MLGQIVRWRCSVQSLVRVAFGCLVCFGGFILILLLYFVSLALLMLTEQNGAWFPSFSSYYPFYQALHAFQSFLNAYIPFPLIPAPLSACEPITPHGLLHLVLHPQHPQTAAPSSSLSQIRDQPSPQVPNKLPLQSAGKPLILFDLLIATTLFTPPQILIPT